MRSLTLVLILFGLISACSDGGSNSPKLDPLSSEDKDRLVGVASSVAGLSGLVVLEPVVSSQASKILSKVGAAENPELTQELQDLLDQANCELLVEVEEPTASQKPRTAQSEWDEIDIPNYTVTASGAGCPVEYEVVVLGQMSGETLNVTYKWSYRAKTPEFAEASGVSELSVTGSASVKQVMGSDSFSMVTSGSFKAKGVSVVEGDFSYGASINQKISFSGLPGLQNKTQNDFPELNMSISQRETYDFQLPDLKAQLVAIISANENSQSASYKINGVSVSESEFRTFTAMLVFPGEDADDTIGGDI